ncbi:hypothetical protein [Zhengella mangrovi]|nr:hypothetical protein [Zhengella mangrovi]
MLKTIAIATLLAGTVVLSHSAKADEHKQSDSLTIAQLDLAAWLESIQR